jgi:hypothetical protein
VNFGPDVNFKQKLNFGPKIEFQLFYNFGPLEMSPTRLSNYVLGHGPRARPVGWLSPARNLNGSCDFGFGLGPGDPNVHL